MTDNISISVSIPSDEEGMLGRECLECKTYFKLKLWTGLPTNYCHCPYCEYEGDSSTFWTQDQIDYAESVAFKQVYQQFIKPPLDSLEESFKDLERSSRNGFIQFKVKITSTGFEFPTKHYSEKELETRILCDNCGLEFSIYGVFSRCPDCKELNAFVIYEKSLELTSKQLSLFSKPDVPLEIKEQSNSFILSSSVSIFDALGKELRLRNPTIYSSVPKNLFQNLTILDQKLNNYISKKHSDYNFLIKLFQVRHLFEHNMGVIDQDFVKKLPEFSKLLGRKYVLTHVELERFIILMRELGELIKGHLNEKNNK